MGAAEKNASTHVLQVAKLFSNIQNSSSALAAAKRELSQLRESYDLQLRDKEDAWAVALESGNRFL